MDAKWVPVLYRQRTIYDRIQAPVSLPDHFRNDKYFLLMEARTTDKPVNQWLILLLAQVDVGARRGGISDAKRGYMKIILSKTILTCAAAAVMLSSVAVANASNLTDYLGTVSIQTQPGKDPDEPDICGITGGASVWFSYIPEKNGTFFLNTDGSNFDTLLGVFVDDGRMLGYSSLIQIACDDNSGANQLTSSLSTAVTNGVEYYIMIDGKNGAHGLAYLNYFLDTSPTISSIATQTINEEQSAGPIAFTIGDTETASTNLQVYGFSSDQNLVTNSAILFSGSGTNRTVTITPTPYRFGTNTITIAVVDGAGNCTSTNFVLNVQKINHTPVAAADTFTRLPNRSISIAISAFLRNDSDIDGDTLTLTSVSPKSQLNCTVVKGSSFVTYNALSGLNSQDSFSYNISDGNGGAASGTVNILVSTNGVTVVY